MRVSLVVCQTLFFNPEMKCRILSGLILELHHCNTFLTVVGSCSFTIFWLPLLQMRILAFSFFLFFNTESYNLFKSFFFFFFSLRVQEFYRMSLNVISFLINLSWNLAHLIGGIKFLVQRKNFLLLIFLLTTHHLSFFFLFLVVLILY